MRQVLVLLLTGLLGSAGNAAAQQLEVGASVASACLGSEGSACGNGNRPALGAHAGLWLDDRLELTFRVSGLTQDPIVGTAFPGDVPFTIGDRSRRFVSGLVVYHFMKGRSVRPMVGIGSGGYQMVSRLECGPPGCQGLSGLPPEGTLRTWHNDAIAVVGLSGAVADRWIWRTGCLSHRFANDHFSTMELFASVGYRFGG